MVRVGGGGDLRDLLPARTTETSVSDASVSVAVFALIGFLGRSFNFFGGVFFLSVACFGVFFLAGSSDSLSDSVSTNIFDLARLAFEVLFPRIDFAVADFLGTTAGLGGLCFLPAPDLRLAGAAECASVSSSEMGRGGALLLVTNPDFLIAGFFLAFSADRDSFLLGLLDGLRYRLNIFILYFYVV